MQHSREKLFLAAALLIAGAAALPLLAEPGLLNTRGGGDSPFLLQRLQQLETAVLDGHLPARWMPDANYGYGYPFYHYYAPLSLYITLFFRFIGFSYVQAIELSQLAGFLAAAAGMFALGQRWFKSEWAGLLTAVAYTAAPFHLVNIYVRGDSLAEFWAMAFYPLVILAVDMVFTPAAAHPPGVRYSVNGRQLAVAFLAISYAGLILSHNISALIFSPFLLLYIVLRWLNRLHGAGYGSRLTDKGSRITPHALRISAGLLLAFALSAWFFVPALAEKDLAQLGPVTEGYFHFNNHFLGVPERPLWQTTFFFDYDVQGREAFRMGLVQSLTILGGFFVLVLRARSRLAANSFGRAPPLGRGRYLFILLTLLVSTAMLLPLSRPLWEHLPLLAFTQFPWRFLSVQAFAGALATGAIALAPWRRLIAPLTVGLLLAAALANLPTDSLILSDADITAERLAQYEWFSGNIGTTVSAEYLPHTVAPRPVSSEWLNSGERRPLRALAGALLFADLQHVTTTRQTWQVETAAGATLLFPTLYWPGWLAEVDGRATQVRPSPGSGLILLDVPAGKHTIVLRLARTPVRLAAEGVSWAAVFILLWLLQPVRLAKAGSFRMLAGVGLLLLLLLSLRLWPERALSSDDLTWDFAQMAYLHHAPAGVPYSNGLTLRQYQYDQEAVTGGQTWTVTTDWEGAAGDEWVTLRLSTPAINRYHEPAPPLIAEESRPVANGRAVFTLTIPENAPSGLVLPQLLVAGGQPQMSSGAARGALFLRPLRLHNTPAAGNADVLLDVKAIQVQQRRPQILDIEVAWFTAVPLSHNYNVALRLTDANGRFLRLADMQPGYGFQPSTLWPAGAWVNDWLALALPMETEAFPYVLVAQLYDVAAPGVPVLTRRLGELWPEDGGSGAGATVHFRPTRPFFELPEDIERVTAVFGDVIQLHGYNLSQSATELSLTLYWGALTPGRPDYTRFVHLVPLGQTEPVAQDDNLPQNGTYPTTQWAVGEVVTDTVTLNVAHLPPGRYQLAAGFYQREQDGRIAGVTAVDMTGVPLSDDRFLLPTTFILP